VRNSAGGGLRRNIHAADRIFGLARVCGVVIVIRMAVVTGGLRHCHLAS
jgi:hypothetical protein